MWPKQIIKHCVRACFAKTDIMLLLQQELREATISKLQAENALEYARSVVDCNNARIQRLKTRIKELESEA